MGAVLVTTTVDSEAAARRLAEAVVTERLAACVHVSGPGESVYHWDGALTWATEWTCTAKTTAASAPALLARLQALHPYELPELLVAPVEGSAPYLAWLARAVEG